ncbi:MAG TPA: PD-(D/E)XK nuclease family protein [Nitriliruptoraceae bacterium]|nr:PD-(D/E)XK nuclease family protein [Nitriliruptoraceae bacterium]
MTEMTPLTDRDRLADPGGGSRDGADHGPGAGPDGAEAGIDGAEAGIDGAGIDGAVAGIDGAELEPTSPPLVGDDGRVRLSFSRIDSLRQCSLKFRYRYLDRLPTRPATYLSFGTSVHSALELFHERTLFGRPDLDDLHQFLYDNWDSSGYAQVPRERQVQDYNRARHTLGRYFQRVVDTWQPAADTEKWFELPVGDTAMVVGSIDRIDVDADGQLHVVDYKTGKLRDRAKVRGSLQLAIYALAVQHLYGRLPATVSLDYVVADIPVVVPVAEMDLDAARAAILEAADQVLAADFTPNPTRLCDWCDYRAACPAWEGDGADVLGPAVVERDRLRRQVRRDLANLRALEQGVEDLSAELAARGLDPVVDESDVDHDATDPAAPATPQPGT